MYLKTVYKRMCMLEKKVSFFVEGEMILFRRKVFSKASMSIEPNQMFAQLYRAKLLLLYTVKA